MAAMMAKTAIAAIISAKVNPFLSDNLLLTLPMRIRVPFLNNAFRKFLVT
jgi:hypothetical protein